MDEQGSDTPMSAGLGALPHRMRPADGEAQGALVLLHGRGADELDLFPLLDELDPERRLIGLTPRGPLALTPGGAHWYIVRRVGFPDATSFHATRERLAGWLDSLPGALGVPLSSTVIGGFSQGAVMSYAMALGKGRPAPAGVLALSGFIPTVENFELDLAGREGFPVAIGHGVHDPIIPVEFGREARAALEAAGTSVTYRESPMAHSLDPGYLAELRGWLTPAIAGVAAG